MVLFLSVNKLNFPLLISHHVLLLLCSLRLILCSADFWRQNRSSEYHEISPAMLGWEVYDAIRSVTTSFYEFRCQTRDVIYGDRCASLATTLRRWNRELVISQSLNVFSSIEECPVTPLKVNSLSTDHDCWRVSLRWNYDLFLPIQAFVGMANCNERTSVCGRLM